VRHLRRTFSTSAWSSRFFGTLARTTIGNKSTGRRRTPLR
jgi:hypothetical protein